MDEKVTVELTVDECNLIMKGLSLLPIQEADGVYHGFGERVSKALDAQKAKQSKK